MADFRQSPPPANALHKRTGAMNMPQRVKRCLGIPRYLVHCPVPITPRCVLAQFSFCACDKLMKWVSSFLRREGRRFELVCLLSGQHPYVLTTFCFPQGPRGAPDAYLGVLGHRKGPKGTPKSQLASPAGQSGLTMGILNTSHLMCALLDEAWGWIVSFLGRAPSHGRANLHLQLGGTEPSGEIPRFSAVSPWCPEEMPRGQSGGPKNDPLCCFSIMVNAVNEANQFTDCLFASGLD